MKHTFTLSFLLTLSIGMQAQLPVNTAARQLDKNNVKASIYTVNNKFFNIYGNYADAYEVPKGKGKSAMGANCLWIGGLDAGGNLHIAANTYRQSGTDYWPGPIDTITPGAFNIANSTPYNKLWKTDCDDITNFVTAFNSGSVTNNTYQIPTDILTYPASGTGNFQRQMAPYFDANGDGNYNPQAHGDYPIIKGQQQILSIFNDADSIHAETYGRAMGIEIHERSYAYSELAIHDTMQAINYTTFYNYTIYNRSDTSYYNVRITDWADVDLGYSLNDYIGTDTVNHFVYCYNDGPIDPAGNSVYGLGYVNKPPVLSHVLLDTPCSTDGIDNDHDGTIDEPGEQFMMERSTYYNNNIGNFPPATTNPSTGVGYYNFMTGFWNDGSAFTSGGTAYGGTQATPYIYPGNPQNNTGWTETSAGNLAGDRRFLMSSGPFTFPAHSKIEWGYAIVFSQDTTQAVNTVTEFNTRVKRDVRNVKYFDNTHQAPACKPAVHPPVTGIKNKTLALKTFIYPNPATSYVNIELAENVISAQIVLSDISGRKINETEMVNGYRTQLDLSTLDKGVYFIEVKQGARRSVEKIIKN